jgi:hypothetical protein
MSQAVMIAVLVLLTLTGLRVANLPPFQRQEPRTAAQPNSPGQVAPTPKTRTTGSSTEVGIGGIAPSPTTEPTSGTAPSTADPTAPSPQPQPTTTQSPINGRW